MATSQATLLGFEQVVEAMRNEYGVSRGKSSSTTFRNCALQVDGKVFVKISSTGQFVVKLSQARIDTLVATGAGLRFNANRGRSAIEWLDVQATSVREWTDLAYEALEYMRGSQ
jgi:hypothetical protein